MSLAQTLFCAANPLRVVDAADFDGTNDYATLASDLTGNADSKQGIFSVWVRIDGGDGTIRKILGTDSASARVLIGADNKFSVAFLSGGFGLAISSTTAYVAGATWRHFLASWDVGITAAHVYVNDVSDLTTTNNDNILLNNTLGAWVLGSDSGAALKFNGCIAELYYTPGQYLDFSKVSNRRKFISASGKPVHLGTTGSLPTGTAPLVYQHIDDGEAVANFATNRGTGGNFTITGTLDTATTSPSD